VWVSTRAIVHEDDVPNVRAWLVAAPICVGSTAQWSRLDFAIFISVARRWTCADEQVAERLARLVTGWREVRPSCLPAGCPTGLR
jgi:hypothetical protein